MEHLFQLNKKTSHELRAGGETPFDPDYHRDSGQASRPMIKGNKKLLQKERFYQEPMEGLPSIPTIIGTQDRLLVPQYNP
ncbi:MAG TPA: hypothetical protein VLO29_00110 [Salegentibacter sp.]|nr:hypothetical protein [Salegentibacter sp.]